MAKENTLLTINAFLLGVTFLAFVVANSGVLTASQLDDFRAGVALVVASFICFLVSTAATLAYSWTADSLNQRKKEPGTILNVFLIVMQSIIAVPMFYLGLLTLTVSVINFVQVDLGTTANDGDNLAIVSVSFLTLAGCGVLAIVVFAVLFRFVAELDSFTKEK
jgi:hypothetical protein